jgi:hypothetical protein
VITEEEWERRFKLYIINTLTASDEWAIDEATAMAENEFDSTEADLTEVPEDSAQEAMSYWDADE